MGRPDNLSHLPYCKRGGFITEFAEFDPMQCGVMPNSVQGADPDQFLALKVALETINDAGYTGKDFNRERAEVIYQVAYRLLVPAHLTLFSKTVLPIRWWH